MFYSVHSQFKTIYFRQRSAAVSEDGHGTSPIYAGVFPKTPQRDIRGCRAVTGEYRPDTLLYTDEKLSSETRPDETSQRTGDHTTMSLRKMDETLPSKTRRPFTSEDERIYQPQKIPCRI
jgi:hypothetical protein